MVQFEVKANGGNSRHYEFIPNFVQLKGKESVGIEVKLKVTQPIPTQRKDNIKGDI